MTIIQRFLFLSEQRKTQTSGASMHRTAFRKICLVPTGRDANIRPEGRRAHARAKDLIPGNRDRRRKERERTALCEPVSFFFSFLPPRDESLRGPKGVTVLRRVRGCTSSPGTFLLRTTTTSITV